MERPPRGLAALLFDLDGTLVDSAPDLAGTADDMRRDRGLAPLGVPLLRAYCGSGARGMLGRAFALQPGDGLYESMRTEFLQRYAARLLAETRAFEDARRVPALLAGRGLRFGVVTNKAVRLAEPLVQAFGLAPAGAVLVGGDSTPYTKPHPEPLLEAARRLGVAPAACVYVGDDPRDIRAGRAAGMITVAAAWGYLGPDEDPARWGADLVMPDLASLLNWVDLA